MLPWQERWIARGQRGFRPGTATDDVHYELALVEEVGLDPRVCAPLRTIYMHLERRFRLGTAVGKPFHATNGIIQGCAVSVLLLNALLSVWARAVEDEVPGTSALLYADDQWAASKADSAAELERRTQAAANVTVEHAV
eukprot:gene19218-biopygen30821